MNIMSAGLYIHIPFCRSRCSYCDFATGMYETELADRYVQCVTNEISVWQQVAQTEEVDTIYFGGGTPSLLTPPQLEEILTTINRRFRVYPGAEITMEMNPGTVSAEKS